MQVLLVWLVLSDLEQLVQHYSANVLYVSSRGRHVHALGQGFFLQQGSCCEDIRIQLVPSYLRFLHAYLLIQCFSMAGCWGSGSSGSLCHPSASGVVPELCGLGGLLVVSTIASSLVQAQPPSTGLWAVLTLVVGLDYLHLPALMAVLAKWLQGTQ